MMYSLILKNALLPVADRLMKTSIRKKMDTLQRMRLWSPEQIEEWQNQRLKELVHHAYHHTRYYRTIFQKCGCTPESIQCKEDLQKLPALTKRKIRDHFQDLIPDSISSIPYKRASTGGSTGEPLVYYLDHNSWSFTNANTILNWEKTGYRYGNKYMALGSTSLFVKKKRSIKHEFYYALKRKQGYNGINMSDDVCSRYVSIIQKERIRYLYGYASSIYLLAKYVATHKIQLDIQACFTTSEVLTHEYRKGISSAFTCKIVDCYGSNDGGITAFSHEEGVFEVGHDTVFRLEDSEPIEDTYPILVTDLFNYAMPLINYKNEDAVAVPSDRDNNHLAVRFNGQVIERVAGRSSDVMELENGSVLTGPGFTILFKDIPAEYYCIEKKGASVICHVKRTDQFRKEHERVILETIQNQAGSEIPVSITYTDEEFRSPSGKRMYMKNEIES